MDRCERLAFFDAIADALAELEPDGVIDRIFLFLTAAAQHGQSDAELLAVGCGNVAFHRARHFGMKAGRRQALWLVDHAVISALQANTLFEFLFGLAAGNHRFG